MTAAALYDIANRLERLAPSHRDPFRFHEEKSELVAELRRMASGGKSFPTNEDRRDAYRIAANDNLMAAINKNAA